MKDYKKNFRRFVSLAAFALSSLGAAPLLAQDIELFSGTNPANTQKPNVLIIIDNTSNWGQNVGGLPAWNSELQALATTVQGLVANGFGDKLRVGMMMFVPGGVGLPSAYGNGSGAGGYMRFAIRDMNATNATQLSGLALGIRDRMLNVNNAQSIEGSNNSAYSQSMAEAYYYYFGKTIRVGFGNDKRDCATNTNNVYTGIGSGSITSAAASYNLISPLLPVYAYTDCGTGSPSNKNQFTSASSNSAVSYNRPADVDLACQRNYIIFVSNGTIDSSDNGPGFSLLQAAVTAENAASRYTQVIPLTYNGESLASFADEWAKFLNEVKNVQTYTINTNESTSNRGIAHQALMQSMATNGGGDFCKATDPASIQACINEAFNKILSVNAVFASVSLPVSSYPQLQNLDQVYMGMFRPDAEGNPRWFGNMKQFKLTVDSNNNPTLVDANDSTAIDPTTGQVFNGKTSFWTTNSTYWSYSPRGLPATSSDAPDGPLVEKGGAAERLRAVYAASGTTSNVATRKVFTCTGCSSQTALSGGTDTSTGATSFSSSNASTLAAALRVTAAEAPDLIKWVRGENVDIEKTDGVTVEARPSIHGDIVHSRPVVLTLSPTSIYVFYGGNDGLIHAINGGRAATGGNEVWSFLPEEFLPRLKRLRANTPVTWAFNTISTSVTMASGSSSATVGSTTGLLLGMYLEGTSNIPKSTYITAIDTATNVVTLSQAALGSISGTLRFVPQAKPAFADGTMTVYQDPTNSKTYLFASMRRGGRFLYAFDITDPVNPQYLWRKGCDHAGISGNNGYGCDSGYDELGETWSEPRIARIGTSLDNQTVLIFGAGYDPTVEDPDPALANSSRTMGRGIFVVNAYTGAVVRQIRESKMDYAVPSDITLIDFDGDGFLDRIYFGDTGGQVWRVDTTGNKDPSSWTTQRIASLGVGEDSGLSGDANRRKFLFSPDVVETAPGSGIYSILLASGDRENPLNGASARSTATTVVNRIYMLLDGAPRGSTVIAETNLEDRTTNTFTPVANNLGWYITLGASGEKGTGSVVTLSGTSYIGTNYPVTSAAGACYSTVGNARFYTVDFLTSAGRPGGSTPSSDITQITQGRFTETVAGGMPPSPVGTIIEIGNNKFMEAVIMGTRTLPVGPAKVGDRFRNYWYKLFDKK